MVRNRLNNDLGPDDAQSYNLTAPGMDSPEASKKLMGLYFWRLVWEDDKAVLRLRSLSDQKKALEAHIADVESQINALKEAKTEAPPPDEVLKAKIDALEKQNKTIISEADNLRENIAVLEYKISSLERYQDRNSKRGR